MALGHYTCLIDDYVFPIFIKWRFCGIVLLLNE